MNCLIEVDVDDGDKAKVATTKVRTARKTHKCNECNGQIAIGEKYEINRGLFGDGWSEFKTCSICKEIRDHFLCGWYYGGVWEELDSYFMDEDFPLSCLSELSKPARDVMIGWIDERCKD